MTIRNDSGVRTIRGLLSQHNLSLYSKRFHLDYYWRIRQRLVSAVWVVNNCHLPFLAWGCQSNNLAQTTIHKQYEVCNSATVPCEKWHP